MKLILDSGKEIEVSQVRMEAWLNSAAHLYTMRVCENIGKNNLVKADLYNDMANEVEAIADGLDSEILDRS